MRSFMLKFKKNRKSKRESQHCVIPDQTIQLAETFCKGVSQLRSHDSLFVASFKILRNSRVAQRLNCCER